MKLRHRPWRIAAGAGAVVAGLSLVAFGAPARAGAGVIHEPAYYVALGGSGSVGEQPTLAAPHGQPTDEGYANDLTETERSRWPDLQLVKLGCPGETTVTMTQGGDRCHYPAGSQLAAALAFLRLHQSTVLVTLDLGFNNLKPCLAGHQVDDACLAQALAAVHEQIAAMVPLLREAGPPGMRLVGVGHYDPFLGTYLSGTAGHSFASESLSVVSRLNDALRSAYNGAGVPMADVAAAFGTAATGSGRLAGVGAVPRNVERACSLTWMCSAAPYGPNQHPNDAGYEVISRAIDDALKGSAP
jgi:lysophospholipase L1-like esterase